MKLTQFNKSVIASAVTSTLFLSLPSFTVNAEEAEVAEKGKIERIEVTSNRRSQSIQDVPYNVSAVSGDELDSANIVDASDMMRGIAGISVVDRGYRNSGNVNGVIIRGVNVDNGSNGDVALSAVPTVASYVNDTPLYANFILKDIEMVEVLRGPQGTLYGSGSLAGTVRYRMNRPDTDEFYGSASVNFSQTDGSDGFNLNSDVMLNMPLSDNFAIRANVGKVDNDGLVDYSNVYVLDNNNYAPAANGGDLATGGPSFRSVKDADTVDITYGRVSAFWQASDDLTFWLSHQSQSDETGGRRQVTRGTHWTTGTEESYGEYQNGAVMLEPSERDVSLTSLEIEWNLGFATLTSSTSTTKHEGMAISDNSGFYAQQEWFTGLYNGTPRPMAKAVRGYDDTAIAQEIRLVSNETKNNIDWVVGFYYMDQDMDAYQESYMPGWVEQVEAEGSLPLWESWGANMVDNDFHYLRKQNFEDMALFGELTYHFSANFRATLGARTFKNEFTNNTELDFPIWPTSQPESSFATEEDDTLFKVNVSYDFDDDTMVYGTVSEGYRRGGANAVPSEGYLAEREEWNKYDSDSVVNYELGLKGYLDNGAHSYTASIFYIDWQNPQLNTTTYWGFFVAANGESAETKGLELELQGYLTEDIHYSLGYAYIKGQLTDDFYVPDAVWSEETYRLQASEGDALPLAPEHTLSASIDYTYTMDNEMYWITQMNGYYQSESQNYLGDNPTYSADIDGFAILNASTRFSTEDWDITLYIKNITNEEGVTGLITEAHMGTKPSESFYGNSSKDYISLPRTIGLSAAYRF